MRSEPTHCSARAFGAMLLTLCSILTSCNESIEFYNATENEIVADTQTADELLKTAWQPTALAKQGSTLYFVDRGTRKLRALDLQTRDVRTIAELAPYEPHLSTPSSVWDEHWGKTLSLLPNGLAVIAGLGRKLMFVDLNSGDTFIFGEDDDVRLPADGILAKNIDFSTLAGFGVAPDKLYLAFDNQIFSLSWHEAPTAAESLEALSHQPLVHVAGTNASGFVTRKGNALDESLTLNEWTDFILHDNILYFWEPPALRAVKDGTILNLGGDGSIVHGNDLKTARLYGLPEHPRIRTCGNSLCSAAYHSNILIRISIDSADFENGNVEGSIRYTELDQPLVADFYDQDNTLYTISLDGGGIRKQSLNNIEQPAELLFGLPNETERFKAIQANNPEVEPNTQLALQSITSLGKYLITNAPSIHRLAIANADRPSIAKSFWLDLTDTPVTRMASLNSEMWMTQRTDLIHLSLDDDGSLTNETYAQFFKSPNFAGLPGQSSSIHLDMPPHLFALSKNLAAWIESSGYLFSDYNGFSSFIVNPVMAFAFPTKDADITLSKLSISSMDQIKNHDALLVFSREMSSKTLLYAANASNIPFSAMATDLKANRAVLLSGTTLPPENLDNVLLSETALPHIDAFDVASDNTLWFYAQNTLFRVDELGIIRRSELCSTLEQPPQALTIIGEGSTPDIYAKLDDGIYKCSEQTLTKYDFRSIRACGSAQYLALAHTPNTFCTSESTCYSTELTLFDAVCLNDKIYLSARDSDGLNAVFSTSLTHPQSPTPALWNGFGIPENGTLDSTRPGSQISVISMDQAHNLYFTFKDTCSIWKYPTHEPFAPNTQLDRVAVSPHLCQANAVAVSPNANTIFAADANALYQVDSGTLKRVAEFNNDILEIGFIHQKPVVLTLDGLYNCSRLPCSLVQPNPVTIDGRTFDYATPALAHPRFTQAHDEDAIFMPVAGSDIILKLSI